MNPLASLLALLLASSASASVLAELQTQAGADALPAVPAVGDAAGVLEMARILAAQDTAGVPGAAARKSGSCRSGENARPTPARPPTT